MTPEQTAALLSYAAAIDPRIRRNDPDERRLQAVAWHAQLRIVDPDPARAAVDAHYARAGADALMPGDIRERVTDRGSAQDQHPAYRPLADAVAAAEHEAGGTDLPALPAAGTPRLGPEQARAALEAAFRRIAAGRPVPDPAPTGYVAERSRHSPRREPATRIPAPMGAATTLCHGSGCAADIQAPAGWDPADQRSPRLYCTACAPPPDDPDVAGRPGAVRRVPDPGTGPVRGPGRGPRSAGTCGSPTRRMVEGAR
jgi:hypothetical protein